MLTKVLQMLTLLFLALPALPAQTPGNRTFFHEDIFVAQGQQIHNAVCIFCSVQVEGDLTGHVIVLFGSLNVTGRVNGGATVVGGNAVIDSQARLGGNAIVVGGNAVYETDESISGNAYVIGGHLSTFGDRARTARRVSVGPTLSVSVSVVAVLLLSLVFFPRRRANPA